MLMFAWIIFAALFVFGSLRVRWNRLNVLKKETTVQRKALKNISLVPLTSENH